MGIIASHASGSAVRRGLLLGGLLIAASASLRLLTPDSISPELASRSLGVLFGAMAAFYANEVPKALTPLARLRDPAAEQSLRRYTGWMLATGGVAYSLAWMSAPFAMANVIAGSALGAAVLLVLIRVARAWRSGHRDAQRAAPTAPLSAPPSTDTREERT